MRHASRYLSLHVDDDGMMVVRGRLTPEVGELLRNALEAHEAELFKADRESSPGQRRADALGEVLRNPDGKEVAVSPAVEAVVSPAMEAVKGPALERWGGDRDIGPETGMPLGRAGPVDYGWALMGMRR